MAENATDYIAYLKSEKVEEMLEQIIEQKQIVISQLKRVDPYVRKTILN